MKFPLNYVLYTTSRSTSGRPRWIQIRIPEVQHKSKSGDIHIHSNKQGKVKNRTYALYKEHQVQVGVETCAPLTLFYWPGLWWTHRKQWHTQLHPDRWCSLYSASTFAKHAVLLPEPWPLIALIFYFTLLRRLEDQIPSIPCSDVPSSSESTFGRCLKRTDNPLDKYGHVFIGPSEIIFVYPKYILGQNLDIS
jgi:hypothetical protein